MTHEERIELAKARGTYRRPLVEGESITFHPAASKAMLGPVSGLVMWDTPNAHKGLGSRMVKVVALYADGTRATWNVRRNFCREWNEKHPPGRLSRKCEYERA